MQTAPNGSPADVSVVVPCYRSASTIARAVESVAAQTRPVAELILVDDGSADGSLEVLESLVRSFPGGRARLIACPQNRGAGAARNIGWEEARGSFIAFLDADDAWHPRKVELQLACMDADPGIMLCGHLTAYPPQRAHDAAAPVVRRITRRQMLLSNPFSTPSVMLRRALPMRFTEQRRHMEDHLLWMRIACAGHAVARLEVPLCTIFKPAYGASGLSADLWPMERADLANYAELRREGRLGWPATLGLWTYSLLKFLRRLLLLGLRGSRPALKPGS